MWNGERRSTLMQRSALKIVPVGGPYVEGRTEVIKVQSHTYQSFYFSLHTNAIDKYIAYWCRHSGQSDLINEAHFTRSCIDQPCGVLIKRMWDSCLLCFSLPTCFLPLIYFISLPLISAKACFVCSEPRCSLIWLLACLWFFHGLKCGFSFALTLLKHLQLYLGGSSVYNRDKVSGDPGLKSCSAHMVDHV